jgi:HEAT repeat protein
MKKDRSCVPFHPSSLIPHPSSLLLGSVLLLFGCGQTAAPLAHGKPVSHWVQALHAGDARLRKKAAEVLGNVGTADPAAIPALIGAVKDRDAKVRRAAILALFKIGPAAEEAIPVLTEAQKDHDAQVRSYAAKALKRIQS